LPAKIRQSRRHLDDGVRDGAVAESGEGASLIMFGVDGAVGDMGVVALESRAGALGNRTGSRNERSDRRRPFEQPATIDRVTPNTATRAIVFI